MGEADRLLLYGAFDGYVPPYNARSNPLHRKKADDTYGAPNARPQSHEYSCRRTRARARNASPARPTLQKISLVTWWVAPFNEREAATVAAVSATDTVTATSAALAAHRWA